MRSDSDCARFRPRIGAPLRDIVRDTLPFLFAMLAVLALITFVPSVVLWLPRLLGYQG